MEGEMKLYSPNYYGEFKCIAERCRHSCCVGWEISVDADTLERYRGIDSSECEILSHIDCDTGLIRLDGERCPFLDEVGLCRIISAYGECAVSEICRRHPRFCHRVGDTVEVGLGAVCEEACRLILTSPDFSVDHTFESSDFDYADETDFDTLSHREKIYGILRSTLSHIEKLDAICREYGLSDKLYDDDSWESIIPELELLDEECGDELFALCQVSPAGISEYSERFLAYLVFRHVSPATDYDNLRARVGFCLLMTRFFESSVSRLPCISEDGCIDIARRLSGEIEYSEDNTDMLIFEFESSL